MAPLIPPIPVEAPVSMASTVGTIPSFPSFPTPAAVESGEDQADDGEKAHRGNRLVPTNAVHTTRRRIRRRISHVHAAVLLGGLALVALVAIGGADRPNDMTPLARLSKPSNQSWIASNQNSERIVDDPVEASPERRSALTATVPVAADGLGQRHLIELEEMLARLDLNPSRADGVVDYQTTSAIRLYQQIAGLPIDGEPSEALLDDLREVVGILDGD